MGDNVDVRSAEAGLAVDTRRLGAICGQLNVGSYFGGVEIVPVTGIHKSCVVALAESSYPLDRATLQTISSCFGVANGRPNDLHHSPVTLRSWEQPS